MSLAGCNDAAVEDDNFQMVAENDPAMEAAIEKARSTVDQFITKYQAIGDDTFAVKVPISDNGTVEHMWMGVTGYDGSHFDGVIDNDPVNVDSVALGDDYRIAKGDISDWSYVENGKMHGNYTMRVMLDQMAPEQAAALREMLADP